MSENTEIKPPPKPAVEDVPDGFEHMRRDSQTASEWVNSQLKLEADAREALPYSFDNCTRPLGALRQNVFACLTCNPPPSSPSTSFQPAGLCYGCSIACHGEHTLVEIFARRNFTCDCGTARFPNTAPCTLRVNATTERKGEVTGEEPSAGNDYNHNFQNRFCGCKEWYVAEQQRGTMYQCIGLASEKDGGCGEDWWHPECLVGLPRDWYKTIEGSKTDGQDAKVESPDAPANPTAAVDPPVDEREEEHPVPPGFPDEDDFESIICYKCVSATPWIKAYADSEGFMTLPYKKHEAGLESNDSVRSVALKRKASEDNDGESTATPKRARTEELDAMVASDAPAPTSTEPTTTSPPKHALLPPTPSGAISILTTTSTFRDRFCRCSTCYPRLRLLPQLLEEEETYHPPNSEDSSEPQEGSTTGGSLLDRGEAALNTVDRVRAIEGVMAYNHLRDKVKAFLQPFAESGKVVGAEDVRKYFEQLRGDEAGIKAAGDGAASSEPQGDESGGGADGGGDGRREQSGY